MYGGASAAEWARSGGLKMMRPELCGCFLSAARLTEIAFSVHDTAPDKSALALEDAFQVKTSGLSHSSYSAFTYLRASTVLFELIATCPCSSWTAPPKDHRIACSAILLLNS